MPEATTFAQSDTGARRRSPFEGHAPFERPTRSGQVGVHLHAASLRSVTLIGTWPNGIAALCEALSVALDSGLAPGTGETTQVSDALLLRTGPEEFLLVGDDALDRTTLLRQQISADIGSVTDLSHARCRVGIEGDRCLDTLAKLFALDLRPELFPLDQVRLTGHHHVPCALHRRALDRFDIYVFSTYAFDQLASLIDAALEYGVALQTE